MATTITRQVAAGEDDAEYGHSSYLESTYLEFGYVDTIPDYVDVWVRVPSVDIPQGSTIDSAYLEFYVPSDQSASVDGIIQAQDEDDAARLTSASDYENATWTAASVSWSPGSWTGGTWVPSPDIASVIQEIVDRGGWSSGNHLGLRWRDDDESSSGFREPQDYDDSSTEAPRLEITYTEPVVYEEHGGTTLAVRGGLETTHHWQADGGTTVKVDTGAAVTPHYSEDGGTTMRVRGGVDVTKKLESHGGTTLRVSGGLTAQKSYDVTAGQVVRVQGGLDTTHSFAATAGQDVKVQGGLSVTRWLWPSVTIPTDDPTRRVLSWPDAWDTRYAVVVDAQQQEVTESPTAPVTGEPREHIQILPEGWAAEDARSPLDRVRVSWDEASDADEYELYRSTTSGDYDDPLVRRDAGQDSYGYVDGPLEDDTYYYRLLTRDEAGNERTEEISVTISSAPEPPTDLSVSVSSGTLELTWSTSPSGDVDHYAVYRALDGPIEPWKGPHATPSGSPWSEDVSSVSGRLLYLVRAVDADGNEEAGVEQMVAVDLDAGSELQRPNQPDILRAVPVSGGEAEVEAGYVREGEDGKAVELRLYANDGAGGAVDYGTILDTVSLNDTTGQSVTLTSSGLSGGNTYKLAVRAATSDGTEDRNTDTVEVTTDATAPGEANLAGETV